MLEFTVKASFNKVDEHGTLENLMTLTYSGSHESLESAVNVEMGKLMTSPTCEYDVCEIYKGDRLLARVWADHVEYVGEEGEGAKPNEAEIWDDAMTELNDTLGHHGPK